MRWRVRLDLFSLLPMQLNETFVGGVSAFYGVVVANDANDAIREGIKGNFEMVESILRGYKHFDVREPRRLRWRP